MPSRNSPINSSPKASPNTPELRRRPARLRQHLTFIAYAIAALPLLGAAQLLIWLVPFARWRGTLGLPAATPPEPRQPVPLRLRARTRHIADAVTWADRVLPLRTKCLARAVATQWLARLRGCPSVLTVAVHADRDRTPDPFHAWVAIAGEIAIGECDRAEYREVVSFAHAAAARSGVAGG